MKSAALVAGLLVFMVQFTVAQPGHLAHAIALA